MLVSEQSVRIHKLQSLMQEQGIDAMLVSSNVGLLYIYGVVFAGVAYIPVEGEVHILVRRPQSLFRESATLHYIRKIEQLQEIVSCGSLRRVALELDELSYGEVERQKGLFASAEFANATTLLRTARRCKTEEEIVAIRHSARQHLKVYNSIPSLYREGMTDIELQIEIEHAMRKEGSVGIFRTFGSAMEIYMGSLLVGDNASQASAYDFALGGGGTDALPLGANGTRIERGMAIMVDMAGNYGSYLSDMTRTYSLGELPEEAYRWHELSRQMHRKVMHQARVGDSCSALYASCLEMAREAGGEHLFMGRDLQAQFVGHGLGLQINELPVLTSRSRDVLEEGMVIAFEPKFVLPRIGAVGVENTYLITSQGVENLTPAPEEIIDLSK